MSKGIFKRLLLALTTHCGLRATKHVSREEQLAIFLRIAVTGIGNREHQERFQRSGETISKSFHRILNMLVSRDFYGRYVKLPSAGIIPPEIKNSPEFYPFFIKCLGAVDSTLLHGFVAAADMARFRSRKGLISQNTFAACRFNQIFCYLLTGWEGSAADGRVFADARRKGFAIPPGYYYLGDAGFPVCDALLVPYHGVCYHLNEWRRASNLKSVLWTPSVFRSAHLHTIQSQECQGTVQSSSRLPTQCD
ncbi:unnamed protein product [Mycena citricolor]|uniref:DDE Tnp4 domain-containing protein n=1 Tax=Mycena citricolor TaxID=2018698 RepID=A0AAD2Q118_9AGAR|nr:unnamed protein product [Mycena citricolor]